MKLFLHGTYCAAEHGTIVVHDSLRSKFHLRAGDYLTVFLDTYISGDYDVLVASGAPPPLSQRLPKWMRLLLCKS